MVFGLLVLGSACVFTYAWYNTVFFIPYSEWLWGVFNQWFDGQKPGYASDLEFVSVFLGSGLVGLSFLCFGLLLHNRKN